MAVRAGFGTPASAPQTGAALLPAARGGVTLTHSTAPAQGSPHRSSSHPKAPEQHKCNVPKPGAAGPGPRSAGWGAQTAPKGTGPIQPHNIPLSTQTLNPLRRGDLLQTRY